MSYIQIFGTLFDASIGGTNLSSKLFYCYDIKKPLMPQQKVTTIDIEKISGLIVANKKFIKYELILNGFMKCANYSDLKSKLQDLSGFLYSDTDQEIILSNENDRYWNGQYLEYKIVGEKDNYTLIDLPFICHDPFAYDLTPDTDDQNIIVKDDTYIISNSGHYYAYPVVTITFNQAQTHIYVQNSTIDNNRFDISKSFGIDDELEIDCKNGTIKLNSYNSPAGFGDGGQSKAEWILFAKGNNVIMVGTDDEDIDIDINITFNKVYFY